jgi:hypothetical protein
MKRFLWIVPAIMVFFASAPAWCEPPYAANGIGVLVPDYTGKSRGMGGAGIAAADGMNMSLENPALDSSFKNPSYALAMVYNRSSTYFGGAETMQFARTTPTLLKFVMPIVQGWAIGWGLAPFSRADSKILMPVQAGDIFTDTVTSSGGINVSSFELSGSYKALSIGTALRYNFGAIQESWFRSFNDSNYVDTTQYLKKKLSGYSVAIGMLVKVHPGTTIGFGYTTKSPVDIVVTVLPGVSTDPEIPVGKERIDLPASWRMGVFSEISRKLSAAVDFSRADWTGVAVTDKEKQMYNNTYSLNAGLRFIPSVNPLAGYFSTIPVSIGFRAGTLYYKSYPKMAGISERAVTCGFEFPFKKNTGSLYTSFELGTRGDKSKNGWDETFVNAGFSLTGKIK